jgi:hypothetical protein
VLEGQFSELFLAAAQLPVKHKRKISKWSCKIELKSCKVHYTGLRKFTLPSMLSFPGKFRGRLVLVLISEAGLSD